MEGHHSAAKARLLGLLSFRILVPNVRQTANEFLGSENRGPWERQLDKSIGSSVTGSAALSHPRMSPEVIGILGSWIALLSFSIIVKQTTDTY